MTVIQGEYVTFKHVKTRKAVMLEIEVPEEMFEDVVAKLGMPIGGSSKAVAVALLDKSKVVTKDDGNPKMVTHAAILVDGDAFRTWVKELEGGGITPDAYLKEQCGIESKSELKYNVEAQRKFTELFQQFQYWMNN